jgi:hypothetical protein
MLLVITLFNYLSNYLYNIVGIVLIFSLFILSIYLFIDSIILIIFILLLLDLLLIFIVLIKKSSSYLIL